MTHSAADCELHLELGRPYGDYIAWLQRQDLSQAELFWRQTLKGFTTPTSLHVGSVMTASPVRMPATPSSRCAFQRLQRLTYRALAQRHQPEPERARTGGMGSAPESL